MELQTGLKPERPDLTYLQGRLDFEEVLESLGIVVAHRQNEWIMCHCPFPENHSNGDKNPSFGFNEEEMRYNCFVCGGGDLLELVTFQMVMDDQEGEIWLQQHSTMEPQKSEDLKAQLDKIIHPAQDKKSIGAMDVSILDKYVPVPVEYLEERGLNAETADAMGLKFDWDDHGGIIIPHFWNTKLVGYQVRHMVMWGGDFLCTKCSKPVPKYTSSVGMPKSTTLYNHDRVTITEAREVIVVESPMTVLYLMSHGRPNVVATFGMWNQEQVEHLRKFEVVYLWPDNDAAGKKNIERAVKELKNYTEVRIVPTVPKPKGDGADINPEFIQAHLFHAFPPSLVPLKGIISPLKVDETNTNYWR